MGHMQDMDAAPFDDAADAAIDDAKCRAAREMDLWWRRVQIDQLVAQLAVMAAEDAGPVAMAYVDQNRAGIPGYHHMALNTRAAALFWAESAMPDELRAYALAALQRIGVTAFAADTRRHVAAGLMRGMAADDAADVIGEVKPAAISLAARKRLMVALWEGLPDADRRTFLSRVDPAGKFRGRG